MKHLWHGAECWHFQMYTVRPAQLVLGMSTPVEYWVWMLCRLFESLIVFLATCWHNDLRAIWQVPNCDTLRLPKLCVSVPESVHFDMQYILYEYRWWRFYSLVNFVHRAGMLTTLVRTIVCWLSCLVTGVHTTQLLTCLHTYLLTYFLTWWYVQSCQYVLYSCAYLLT